jgi:hypothetical protein
MGLRPPQPPFSDWPVQLTLPSGYIWYTEPHVFVTQTHIEHATILDTLAMSEKIDTAMRLRKTEGVKYGGLLIIHDWRNLKTWDPDARQALIDRAIARGRGTRRGIVIAIDVNPVFRMLAHVANATLSAVGVARVQLVDVLEPTLEKYAVQKPKYGARFPVDGERSERDSVPPRVPSTRPRG